MNKEVTPLWSKKDIDKAEVQALSEKMRVSPLVASVLLRRDISAKEDLLFFLEDDARHLHNSFLFKHMHEVLERISEAVENEEKVAVYGDKDADGIGATVLLVETLTDLGLDVRWQVPTGEENYGLSEESVRDFANDGRQLLLTVDCGISKFNEIALASELGMDIIVLDHHQPHPEKLPEPALIVNPKTTDDEHYPFVHISGCAVVSKLVWALCLAKTEIFDAEFCLIYAECVDGTKWSLSASVICNMLVTQSKSITVDLSEDNARHQLDDFVSFIASHRLFTFDGKEQKEHFKTLFPSADIYLAEFKDLIYKQLPAIKGYSLENIAQKSKTARYSSASNSMAEMQNELFIFFQREKYKDFFQPFMQSLDLVALTTISDMMPLVNENRILVKQGIKSINLFERPALKELLIALQLTGMPLDNKVLSWQLIPVLNAAGRMGQGHLPIELLLERDPQRIKDLVKQLIGINQERKEKGDKLYRSVRKQAEKTLAEYDNKVVLVQDNEILRGLTGIIANRLLNTFKASVIVLTEREAVVSGSIRTSSRTFIAQLFSQHEAFFLDCGGHENAGGFSLPASQLDEFKASLKRFTKQFKDDTLATDKPITIDATIPLGYPLEKLYDVQRQLAPYGQKFPPLTFLVEGLVLQSVQLIGHDNAHLKINLLSGDFLWPCIYWNSVEAYRVDFDDGDTVSATFTITNNFFRGQMKQQLEIQDLKRYTS